MPSPCFLRLFHLVYKNKPPFCFKAYYAVVGTRLAVNLAVVQPLVQQIITSCPENCPSVMKGLTSLCTVYSYFRDAFLHKENGPFTWPGHVVHNPPRWIAKDCGSLQNKATSTSQAWLLVWMSKFFKIALNWRLLYSSAIQNDRFCTILWYDLQLVVQLRPIWDLRDIF